MSQHYWSASHLWRGNYKYFYHLLWGRCDLDCKASRLQSLILYRPRKWNISPIPGEGESLLQALFPSIIFALVKAMMLAAVMAPTMLTIPSFRHTPRRIGDKPPIKRRRRPSNAAWYVSIASVAQRVQGGAIVTTPMQLRLYSRLLVLRRTSSPRAQRGFLSQPSTPTYNLSALVIWLKIIFRCMYHGLQHEGSIYYPHTGRWVWRCNWGLLGVPCNNRGLPVVPLVEVFAMCSIPVPKIFLRELKWQWRHC